jgi:hypothetical protein
MKDSLSEIRFRKNIPTSEKYQFTKKTGQFKIVWSILGNFPKFKILRLTPNCAFDINFQIQDFRLKSQQVIS